MLEVRQLIVRSQAQSSVVPLLGPIDLSVSAGDALVVMGETGAGKSLIAQAIMGALPDSLSSSGEISLNGIRLDTMPNTRRQMLWGRQIALLPQEPWLALDPLMRARSQVSESHHLVAGHSRKHARKLTEMDFNSLGLIGAERKRPGELSGGMCQRVAFAAAVAGGAPLLLADEPTKGLDPERSRRIVELLTETATCGGALIVITHDIAVAQAVGGSIIVLKDGDLIEYGPTSNVLGSPQHPYTRALVDANPALWPSATANSTDDPVLIANDLAVGHGDLTLIENFELSLSSRERIAITGPSGIGKTTLIDTLAGLRHPLAGKIRRQPSVGPNGIQKIYQDPPTAFSNHVSLATSLDDVAALHSIDWEEIERLLHSLEIDTAILSRRPSQVSGGELQRIAIARVLAIKPAVLLADEPTSRLDPLTQKLTMQLLADACEESNSAVVLVTHDSVMAQNWAHRVQSINSHNKDST